MALNGRVLLLNQTYEPLGTVSVARAIIMTFKNTVFVEEWDGDRVLRSAHDKWPVPSVIRRGTYINVRRRREQSGMKRLRIYMRDKFRCQYCGEKKGAAELTLDHIMPERVITTFITTTGELLRPCSWTILPYEVELTTDPKTSSKPC